MAHRILGIDLGAYSVKVIIANPGFRTAAVTDFIERPVPPGDEPYEVRAAGVLGDIIREQKLDHDYPYAAVPGDKLFIHILEFPFRNLRRLELEKAVGAELEGILPVDLEDMVFGFESLPPGLGQSAVARAPDESAQLPTGSEFDESPGDRATDNEPTQVYHDPTRPEPRPGPAGVVYGRVASPTSGMRVLACAMETERAREMLDRVNERAMMPRGLVAAPASYARIAERLARAGGDRSGAAHDPIAIIDIGHERTDVCVVKDGRAVFARTITRAGRHVTEAISREWRLSPERAEQAKHEDGFIGSIAEPPQTEDWQQIHRVLVTELEPLGKDIKRTLSSCRAKTGASVGQVLLVGGGSRLRGLPSFLAEKLNLPVSLLGDDDAVNIYGSKLVEQGIGADIACLAAGVAFEGATGRPHFDLRQGELAYKVDLSFIRQKAAVLATAMLFIVAFVALNAYASLYKLRAAETNLERRLALETSELFGQSLSAEQALERTGDQAESAKSPLPKMTAYDILLEINRKMPNRKEVTVNVSNLDIKPTKITIKASAASNAEIDKIEDALKEIDCFSDVTRGSTSTGVNNVRNFSLSIKSNCM
ncbi:MAG: pilus assembly protein PilM [Proteobacteria bacterium]|nr:pilus assembly protein PilM [Pseudomonadota bacterium]